MPFGICPWLRQACPHFDRDGCGSPEAERCIHVVSGRAEAWILTAMGALSGVVPTSSKLRETIEEALAEGTAVERREEMSALSHREVEVLRACLEGGKNKEIGERLHISVHTVRNHVKSIYEKLGVRSRAELFSRYSLLRNRLSSSIGGASPDRAPNGRAPSPSETRGNADEPPKQIEL